MQCYSDPNYSKMKLKSMTLAIIVLVSIYSTYTIAAGDPVRGKSLYATCGACHGQQAEGISAVKAPALRGLQTWYIIRQLQNFKQGIRGSNPKDTYGMQMAPIVQLLPDEQAMEDVAAYIQTLNE